MLITFYFKVMQLGFSGTRISWLQEIFTQPQEWKRFRIRLEMGHAENGSFQYFC